MDDIGVALENVSIKSKRQNSLMKGSFKRLNLSFLSSRSDITSSSLEGEVGPEEMGAFLIKIGFMDFVKIAFYDRLPSISDELGALFIKSDDIPLQLLNEETISQSSTRDVDAPCLRHFRQWIRIRELGLKMYELARRIQSNSSKSDLDSVMSDLSADTVSCLISLTTHCARNAPDAPTTSLIDKFNSQLEEISSISSSGKLSKKAEKAKIAIGALHKEILTVSKQCEISTRNKFSVEKERIMRMETSDEQITEQVRIDYGIDPNKLDFDGVLKVFKNELKLPEFKGKVTQFSFETFGKHGVIYSASLPTTFEMVAVKAPHVHDDDSSIDENRLSKRTLREARIWVRSRHANVLPLLGYWPDFHPPLNSKDVHSWRLCPNLVSPWCKNDSLSAYFEHLGSECGSKERLKAIYEVSLGLQHLHSCEPPIIHGDLKPSDIVVYQGRACIMDFSISKIQEETSGLTTMPDGGQPIYQAQELRSKSITRSTTFTDIYSFGCLFFEILTSNRPFEGNYKEIISHPYKTPPRDPDLKVEAHWSLMQWCWYIFPEARPRADRVAQILKVFYDTANKM